MSDSVRRETLRDVLRAHIGAHSDIVANAILASGVLDRIRADAWDEGFHGRSLQDNPYRSEARDG